jgi:hypothetical protein
MLGLHMTNCISSIVLSDNDDFVYIYIYNIILQCFIEQYDTRYHSLEMLLYLELTLYIFYGLVLNICCNIKCR